MQKKSILCAAIILVIIAALLLSVPRLPVSQQGNKLSVTVTTNIIADAVHAIAGDTVTVHCLMQPGIDPHSYHARLSDMRAMLGADLIFYNGLHLEGKMAAVLHKMAHIKPTYAVSDALVANQLITSEEFDEMYDPHIWFDVTLWKQVVIFIADILCSHDPEHADIYQTRLEQYLHVLTALDAGIRTELSKIPLEQRFLITTHDAFSYFGRSYNIHVTGLQGVNLDAEPCIKNMQELIEFICFHKIPAIFVETSLPERSMHAIAQAVLARNHTVRIGDELYSDTLGPKESDAGTYVDMLMHNTNALVRGLNSR